jgi:pimeloyl-ACP methyl ester carboxylesterase
VAASAAELGRSGGLGVSMGLTSGSTLVVAVLLAVLAPLLCAAVWDRMPRRRWLRWLSRVAMVATCQVLALLVGGLALNDTYGFYTSWSELFGTSVRSVAVPVPQGRLDRSDAAQIHSAFLAGHGLVLPWVIPGPASGVPAQRALVYLPAAYGDPAAQAARFPVVELLYGFPSSPKAWVHNLGLQHLLDALIRSERSVPFIAVMPTQNVALPRDTQCVNVVGGPRVETYLTTDVRRAALQNLRALPDRSGWTIMGFSAGGYCATNLAMRHPELFSAAVALSGYARPSHDRLTGELFGGNIALRNDNTPLWRARHRPVPMSLLLLTSRQDHQSYTETVQLAAAARPPLKVWTVILHHGGHNLAVVTAMLPTAFGWLSRQVGAPLAPLPSLDGQQPARTPTPPAASAGPRPSTRP